MQPVLKFSAGCVIALCALLCKLYLPSTFTSLSATDQVINISYSDCTMGHAQIRWNHTSLGKFANSSVDTLC